MAHPTERELLDLGKETGHQGRTLEKAIRLFGILQAIASDSFLGGRLALKGGTALNAFHLDLPRLSVDIDLNYIGPLDEGAMPAERREIDAALPRILTAKGCAVEGRKLGSSGSRWNLGFDSALGGGGSLKIDRGTLNASRCSAPSGCRRPLSGPGR